MTKSVTFEKRKANVLKHLFCYALLLIPMAHFIVFWLCVHAEALILPFQDADTGAFTFENFKTVFVMFEPGGPLVEVLGNTLLYYAQHLISAFVIAPLFAYFLYKKILGYKLFNVIFMLPMIVSTVVMVGIFKNIIAKDGFIGAVWTEIFGEYKNPLLNPDTSTLTIIVYCLWTGFGMNLILFSGAMVKIPPEIIESVQLDGIGFMQEFFTIELPLIWPTLSISLLLGVNGIFSASGPILYMTGGMYNTWTINYWFYEFVIKGQEFELASAFGLVLSLAGAPLTVLVVWLRKKLPADVQY